MAGGTVEDVDATASATKRAARQKLAGCAGCGGIVLVAALGLAIWAAPDASDPAESVSMAADAPGDMMIRPGDVPGEWPLTVSSVEVVCGANRRAVFGEAEGRAYPLNGSALADHGSYQGRYAVGDLRTIQKLNPAMAKYGRVFFSPSDVVQVAVQRCIQRRMVDL